MFYVVNLLLLSRSFFPNFSQGLFPKIAGKSLAGNDHFSLVFNKLVA